jgi:hypothetical protein
VGRQITKQMALKIVKKLKATLSESRSSAHEVYEVWHREVLIAFVSVRRGSDKEQGHDYVPGDIHVSTRQAKDLAKCPMSYEDYLRLMREKGILPDEG